jgi:hypothetical protein
MPVHINGRDEAMADALQAELTSVGYDWHNNAMLKMQKKEELDHSPDIADAFVLTFAGNLSDAWLSGGVYRASVDAGYDVFSTSEVQRYGGMKSWNNNNMMGGI